MGKMYVYSLDYDGCMAAKSLEELLEENTDLINEIIGHINAGHEVRICVGSNRQNLAEDFLNSYRYKVPSVFTHIQR